MSVPTPPNGPVTPHPQGPRSEVGAGAGVGPGASKHRAPVRTVVFTELDSPFGVPHLFELLESPGCAVVAVVAGREGRATTGGVMDLPDRWGRAVRRDVLHALAGAGIPLFEVADVRSGSLVDALGALAPDLIVSAGCRRILPPAILGVPSRAAVNFHPSPLPDLRGRDPWFWTILTGTPTTAATVHHMVTRVDAGDVVFQTPIQVTPRDTASTLRHKTTLESLRLVGRLLDAVASGQVPRHAQDPRRGRVFGEPTDADRQVDWSAPAATVDRVIRASLLSPGAITGYRGHTLRITDAELGTDASLLQVDAAPGSVVKVTANGIAVKAGVGHLVIRRFALEGRTMTATEAVGLFGGEAAHDRFS